MMERYNKPLTSVVVVIMLMISFTLVFLCAEDVSANEIELEKDVIENSTLSNQNIRTPAEWETTEKVLYAGTSDYTTFNTDLGNVLDDILISTDHLSPYDLEAYWVRDYGPISIMDGDKLEFMDMGYASQVCNGDGSEIYYNCNRFAATYGNDETIDVNTLWDLSVEEMEGGYYGDPEGLFFHGGDFMVDSGGIFYYGFGGISDDIEDYEDDFGFYEVNEVTHIHQHIDMYAKLLSENTVIIAEAVDKAYLEEGQEYLGDSDRNTLNSLADYFESRTARNGEPYNVFRVPAWKEVRDNGQDWNLVLISYTNSLIVNTIWENNIIIPTYNTNGEYDWDEHVLDIYSEALDDDYNIYTVYSSDVIKGVGTDCNGGGAVHCATMQIPRENAAPVISDVNVQLSSDKATISADITDDRSGFEPLLYYREHGDFTDTSETSKEDDTYFFEIDITPGITYEYFIRVEDSDGAVTYHGDAWDSYTFEIPLPHIYITSPSWGQSFSTSTVNAQWTSDDHGTVDYYRVSLSGGSWINKGKSTSHTFYNVPDGTNIVSVRAYRDGVYNTDAVIFYVDTSGGGPGPIIPLSTSISVRDDTAIIEWDLEARDLFETDYYYEIQLNDGEWLNVGTSTSHAFSDLDEGEHVATVLMRSRNGDVWRESVEFVVGGDSP